MASPLKPGDRIAVTHQCRTPEGVEYEHTVPVDIVKVDSEDPPSRPRQPVLGSSGHRRGPG